MTFDAEQLRELCRARDAGIVASAAGTSSDARALLRASTPDEKAQLIADGQQARQVMIEENLGLVGHVVGRLRPGHGLDRDDLFQEGVVGLAKAVDRFDPDRARHFSSFAVPHIHGAVITLLTTRGESMRRSDGETIDAVRRETQRRADLGLSTSNADLGAALRMTGSRLVAALAYRRPASLTTPSGEDVDAVDPHAQRRAENAGAVTASSLLTMLPERERQALIAVHSDRPTPTPLKEIAAELGYSPVQLRKLVASGHRHLRSLLGKSDPEAGSTRPGSDAVNGNRELSAPRLAKPRSFGH